MRKLFNFLKEPAVIVGVFFIFLILMSGGVSAEQGNLGTFKQGESVNLIQSCDDCTFNNITTILLGDKTLLVLNVPMQSDSSGTFYNYTLNSTYTQTMGKYEICGVSDDSSGTNWCFDIEITPSGTLFTNALSIPVFLPMGLMLLITVFWIFLAGRVNSEPVKFAFIIFGAIFLIFSIAFGIIASREILFGFPLLFGFVNSFYRIFIITVTWGSIVAVIVIMFFVIKKTFSTKGYILTK